MTTSERLILGKSDPSSCIACGWFSKKDDLSICDYCAAEAEEQRIKISDKISNYEREFHLAFTRKAKDPYKDHPDNITSFDVDVSEFREPTETEVRVKDLIAAIDEARKPKKESVDLQSSFAALQGELTDVMYAIETYDNRSFK